VGIHHQVKIRANRSAHEPDGFEILFGAERQPHFVRTETQIGNSGGFFGVSLRWHVHARAAVKSNPVAHAATNRLRKRHAEGLCHQVVKSDLDRAIDLGTIRILARAVEKLHAQRVWIRQRAAL